MTELAYMVREDWGQHGTGMQEQSAVIRDWLGEPPYLVAVEKPAALTNGHSADAEVIEYLVPDPRDRVVAGFSDLRALETDAVDLLVVLHPFDRKQIETVRRALAAGNVGRAFGLIWAPTDRIRVWLDAFGALDLHSGSACDAPDPLMLEAARMIEAQQYNGLESGHGKETVVQLVRAFHDEGYEYDRDAWLRAYFKVGGDFDHAESIARLVDEMRAGVRHRVKDRYVAGIFDVIRERAALDADGDL